MSAINLGIRFLLELAGIAALAYWGWQSASGTAARIALAVGIPAVLIVVWAFIVAPGANNPIPQSVRIVIGSVLLLLAAGALALAGQRTIALAFAAVIVVNTLLLFVLGE